MVTILGAAFYEIWSDHGNCEKVENMVRLLWLRLSATPFHSFLSCAHTGYVYCRLKPVDSLKRSRAAPPFNQVNSIEVLPQLYPNSLSASLDEPAEPIQPGDVFPRR